MPNVRFFFLFKVNSPRPDQPDFLYDVFFFVMPLILIK